MTEPNDREDMNNHDYDQLVEQRTRPRTPHHAVQMIVADGKLTPKKAEEILREEGLPLLHDDWECLHDVTSNSLWWLPNTIIFYAWRDLKRAWEQCERYRVWGHDLWRDDYDGQNQFISLQDAEKELHTDLLIGLVRAFGVDAEGVKRQIPSEEWKELEFGFDDNFAALGFDGQVIYSYVFVLRHEVVPLLISERLAIDPERIEKMLENSENVQRERGDKSISRRGRKPDPEVDRFWIEIVKATSTGHHGSQKALTAHMARWAEQNDCGYDPETIRKKVGSLYREMGWRDGSAD